MNDHASSGFWTRLERRAARADVDHVAAPPRAVNTSLAQTTVVVALAWGVVAFGGAYRWTSWPLVAFCLGASAIAWTIPRGRAPMALVAPLLAVAVAVCLQVLPLPPSLIAVFSPGAVPVVSRLTEVEPGVADARVFSIMPEMTRHGLALFCTFAILLVSAARLLTVAGARWFVRSLTVMGVVLAGIALQQKASSEGLVYGFWEPYLAAQPFGPFVNRNHFAGWMLMALPMTLALVCFEVARGMQHVRATFYERILWLGSRQASTLVLLVMASMIMAVALVATMSRSGIGAFSMGLTITGGFVLRGLPRKRHRSVATACLVALGLIAYAIVGTDVIANRFANANWSQVNGRLQAWEDAAAIGRQFAVTGTGLNTYGTAARFFTRYDYDQVGLFQQAHNDYAQLFAEGGLLVTVPVLVLVAIFVIQVWRRFGEDERGNQTWWIRAGAVTGLVCMAIQETVEFSLQMPGNAVLFVLLAAVAAHHRERRLANLPPGRR